MKTQALFAKIFAGSACVFFLLTPCARAGSLLHFRFHYFDQPSRGQLMKEIETQILHNYAGYNLKKSFAPKRGALIAIEEKIADPSPAISDLDYNSVAYHKALPAHASANLQFFDRIRKGLALYRDSHIVFQSTTPLPYLGLGIDFVRVGRHVYSATDNLDLEIKKGDRLLEVDAKSVDFWIEDLQNYISANSPAARIQLAVDALGLRNFRYPSAAQAKLKFERLEDKKQFEVLAPWFLATPNYREDFKVYLAAKGIDASEDRASEIIIQNQRFWNPNNADYREAFSFNELENFSQYDSMAENSELVLRTGIWKTADKSHGVLQIFSFGSEHVRAGAFNAAFVAVIESTLADFKAKNLPVILDVRNNGGGSTDLVFAVVKLFLKQGQSLPPPGWAFRLSRSTANLLENLEILSARSEKRLQIYGTDVTAILDKINTVIKDPRALSKITTETPVVNGQSLMNDSKLESFANPLVLLTGPRCRSACEVFTRLLGFERPARGDTPAQAARALILGQPTEGTGLGYFENGNELKEFSTTRADSTGHITLKLPNFLSTVIPKSENLVIVNETAEMCVENKAFVPKVEYEKTLDDVLNNDRGIYQKAAALF